MVGTDLKGACPGFELVSIEVVSALPGDRPGRPAPARAGGLTQRGKGGGTAVPVN